MTLDQEALDRRVRIPGARIALWSPHAARIHPARLVRGLADVVEAMGVAIYEGTEVTRVEPSRAVTRHGTVRASYVLRALEGFTADLAGHRRDWLPMNSSMVATAPLPEAVWEEIGWQGAEVLGDEAHSYCYAQRTADGRIAIGGRGVPVPVRLAARRRGAHPAADGRPAAGDPAPALPRRRRGAARARVVRCARGAPRLVRDRAPGPGDRAGLGRWLRRARRHVDEPGGPHDARPRARAGTPT